MRRTVHKKFSAAIFDLDGVIIDTGKEHRAAWEDVFETLEIPVEDGVIDSVFGMRNEDIVPKLFGIEDAPEVERIAHMKEEKYRSHVAHKLSTVPGVEDFIQLLRQHSIKIAVATSAPKENVDLVFSLLNVMGTFDVIVRGDEVPHGKPAPDIFLEAARRLGVQPTDAVVFEDALVGVQAAQKAGMAVVALTTTHDASELQSADFVVSNFSDIALRQLF